MLKKVGIAVVVCLVGLVVLGMLPQSAESKERMRMRLAIEDCWKTQQRKSLHPEAARMAAGACEMMEDSFKKRWGSAP